MYFTINPIPLRTSFNLKENWDRYRKEIEDKLSEKWWLPTNCQKGEKILRTIIVKAASQHIPSVRHRINTEPIPVEILEVISDPEIPPRSLYNRSTTRSPEQQTNIGEKHGDSSWRHWTTGQTLPNCGELSKTENHRQGMRTNPSLVTTLIFPKADCQLLQQTVHYIKAWQTHLFPCDPASV